jgi:hypothetical protein
VPLRIPVPRPLLPLLCAAAVLAGACRPGGDTITTERFVRANVALRMVNDSGPKADQQRKAALRRAGVTAADLRRFVTVNARRKPSTLAKAWEAIDDSVQRRLSAASAAQKPGQPMVPPSAPIAGPGAQPAVVPAPPINPAKAEMMRRGAPRQELPINPPPTTAAPPPPPGVTKAPAPPVAVPDTATPPR